MKGVYTNEYCLIASPPVLHSFSKKSLIVNVRWPFVTCCNDNICDKKCTVLVNELGRLHVDSLHIWFADWW